MELLLLVLWPDLTELYETLPKSAFDDEPFAEIYWKLFVLLDEDSVKTPADLIAQLKTRLKQK